MQSLIQSLRSRNHLPFLYPHCVSHSGTSKLPPTYAIRLEIVKKNYIQPDLIVYARFIKKLYPLPETSASSPAFIDHDALYAAYKALPEPRPFHLRPQDVNALLDVFLERRNFVKPNQLDSYFHKSAKKTVRLYEAMMRVRHNYVAQTEDIMREFQQYELPLTNTEKTRFLFYFFYRDKKDVLEKVATAHDEYNNRKSDLGYNDFNKEVTDALLQDKELLDISKINMLLFHASRHNRPEVLNSLITLIGEKYPPNSETLKILLDHYGQQAPDAEQFVKWISKLLSGGTSIDINIVNSIIKGLLHADQLSLAEDILTQIFVLEEIKTNAETDDQVRLDKQLTYSDVRAYEGILLKVNQLPIEERNKFKLYPNSSTFTPLIKYYCRSPGIHNSFSKVWYLMDLMYNKYHIPLRTRSFLDIFGRFNMPHNEWELKEFNFFLSKMLEIEQEQKTAAWLNQGEGSFLKLSGRLHVEVVNAFLQILSAMGGDVAEEYTRSILEEQEAYFNLLRTSKEFHSRGRKSTKGLITKQTTFVNLNLLKDVLMRAKAIALRH